MIRCRCSSVQARLNSLANSGIAEHVKDDVIVEIRNEIPPDTVAIVLNVLHFGGKAMRRQIDPKQPWNSKRGHAIHHQVVSEIRQGVSQRRQLPIEHGYDTWFGRMKDHV